MHREEKNQNTFFKGEIKTLEMFFAQIFLISNVGRVTDFFVSILCVFNCILVGVWDV